MNWLDFLIIIFLLMFAFAGMSRGFIGELFDVLIILLGCGVAFSFYRVAGDFFTRTLGIFIPNIYFMIWVIIFACAAVILFLIGSHIERRSRKGFPKLLWRGLGVLMGFIKGVLVLFLLFSFLGHRISQGKIYNAAKNSKAVRIIQATRPVFSSYISVFADPRSRHEIRKFLKESEFSRPPGKHLRR